MQRRHLLPKLLDALSTSPVVLLNGARQTGKSTLVEHLAAHEFPAQYLTFDDIDVLSAAASDPAGFVAGLEGRVVLDEIQRVPELFLPIKASIDKNRKPGRFLLTGSANILLLPKLSETLVGRMEILRLWPLSYAEMQKHGNDKSNNFIDKLFDMDNTKFSALKINQKIDRKKIISHIISGGYPEMLKRTSALQRHNWFKSYILTLFQREIKSFSNIEGLRELPNLLALLSARTSTLLNYAELSRSTALAQTTLKRYMILLEMTFLIHMLPAWSNNLSKRFVKSPKIVLNDTGLAAYLLGYDENKLLQDPQSLGQLFETFVVNEVKKQIGWSQSQPQLFHFRSQAGQEVDLILENASKEIIGIEIKAKNTLAENDFKGLHALSEIAGKKFLRGIIFYLGQNIIPVAKNIHVLPVSTLLE